jgi:hypothetical protein
MADSTQQLEALGMQLGPRGYAPQMTRFAPEIITRAWNKEIRFSPPLVLRCSSRGGPPRIYNSPVWIQVRAVLQLPFALRSIR